MTEMNLPFDLPLEFPLPFRLLLHVPARRRHVELHTLRLELSFQDTPIETLKFEKLKLGKNENFALGIDEHPVRGAPGQHGVVTDADEPVLAQRPDLKDIRWRTVGGGVQQCVLRRDGNVSARLLKIPPGVAVPSHGHGGVEFTQVLSGGYFDGEVAFTRGDIQIVAHESPHQPIAMSDEYCICLAITDAPLRFTALLPRLFQPLFRI